LQSKMQCLCVSRTTSQGMKSERRKPAHTNYQYQIDIFQNRKLQMQVGQL
jgi:hypothetical protein